MILRGALFSGKHITLDVDPGPASSQMPARSTAAVDARTSVGVQSPGARVPGLTVAELLEDAYVAVPTPAELSLEAVSAWLKDTDASARAALADLLAADIDEVRASARSDGLTAGRAQGLREAQDKAQKSLAALAALVREAEAAFASDTTALAEQCADVVAAAFAKIVGEQLGTRAAALGAVLEVLRRAKEERELVIRVSEIDLPLLEPVRAAIADALGGRTFSLVSDTRVASGGCIVESQLGSLDGRLELQLRAWLETIRVAKTTREPPP
jgi:flagellar biosynthesis/type III secretory pathway protein FliH